jgi:acyl-coenzyme A thioesterase PaaI-like protein
VPVTREARDRHVNCMICGERNPWSLGLCFQANDSNVMSARFQAHPRFQGYEGILHGGMISALLDAAMTHCLFHHGVHAVTADLHVRFVKPAPCEALLELRSWLLSARSPLYRVAADLLHEQQVVAKAEAKFMQCQICP